MNTERSVCVPTGAEGPSVTGVAGDSGRSGKRGDAWRHSRETLNALAKRATLLLLST